MRGRGCIPDNVEHVGGSKTHTARHALAHDRLAPTVVTRVEIKLITKHDMSQNKLFIA